ncbi:MAG: DNA mismatch repair protein MutS [Mariprofundales bacterium]
MMQQYLRIKSEYSDCILFYRMGDFYEMFFEDAELASSLLGIALTRRGKSNGSDIPMAGVPWHQGATYLAKLVEAGQRVAICEQMEPPGKQKLPVKREVVRVITAGTLTESELLDAEHSSLLAALFVDDNGWGVAAIDVASGRWNLRFGETALQMEECLNVLKAAELLLLKQQHISAEIKEISNTHIPGDWMFTAQVADEQLKRCFGVSEIGSLNVRSHTQVFAAIGAVLAYLQQTQKCKLDYLSLPVLHETPTGMQIDARSRRNLEAHISLGGEVRGSIISVLDMTNTPMGARLLRAWIDEPLGNVEQIRKRHDAVQWLLENTISYDQLCNLLAQMRDLERILTRISLGRGFPRDYRGMADSLLLLPQFGEILQSSTGILRPIAKSMRGFEKIGNTLDSAIALNPPALERDGGVIRNGFDEKLDNLRKISANADSWLKEYEQQQRKITGISGLRVKYNKIFGYFIEVSRAQSANVPRNYVRKQTLVNAERFTTDALHSYEGEILGAREEALQYENECMKSLRNKLCQHATALLEAAHAIAALDVLCCFSTLAKQFNYVRPHMHNGKQLEIKAGRHPVVEQNIRDGDFVPNETQMHMGKRRCMLLTGPNMGGKSTYMRQTAWIVWLAHIGCFVPATEANIPLIKRMFTRIGAGDELASGRSTFMVEMMETAAIINQLEARSLVIVDEIGRGTSTHDGLAIAQSVAEKLAQSQDVLTLFATHYHELTVLPNSFRAAFNMSVQVREWDGEVIFLHKVEEGAADKSYGIAVAQLAGIPKAVLCRAEEILQVLETQAIETSYSRQLSLFAASEDVSNVPDNSISSVNAQSLMQQNALLDRLLALKVEQMRPIEALQELDELYQQAQQIHSQES